MICLNELNFKHEAFVKGLFDYSYLDKFEIKDFEKKLIFKIVIKIVTKKT